MSRNRFREINLSLQLVNNNGSAKTNDKMLKVRQLADIVFDNNNELFLVRRKDDSICTMATNYDPYEPVGSSVLYL